MKFTKMHSLGNDFCIIEDCDLEFGKFAKEILDRHVGVGADGLIVVRRRPLLIKCYNCFKIRYRLLFEGGFSLCELCFI